MAPSTLARLRAEYHLSLVELLAVCCAGRTDVHQVCSFRKCVPHFLPNASVCVCHSVELCSQKPT